ncbi:hypothetical protein [Azoarcus sp. KH32C]|uniref:hypothetical protein n=1 Tax=Azoarcus sp. KH32C TaxID=748247 RepID=UPI0002386EC6|nr:hypothetical protein [Azoarcus sp. KH32C]BAL24446.1 hypothetical protein AZKH_2135 [Azoarcus sp. KH32C]
MSPSFQRSVTLTFALLALGTVQAADIYRCESEAAPTYQATQCPQSGRKLALPVTEPAETDRKLSDLTRQRERDFVRQTDAERDRQARMAESERAERTLAEQRQAARCSRYVRQADKLEDESGAFRRATRRKRVKDVRARELRDQYFTECLGNR